MNLFEDHRINEFMLVKKFNLNLLETTLNSKMALEGGNYFCQCFYWETEYCPKGERPGFTECYSLMAR